MILYYMQSNNMTGLGDYSMSNLFGTMRNKPLINLLIFQMQLKLLCIQKALMRWNRWTLTQPFYAASIKIGRASCRERVETSVVGGRRRNKKANDTRGNIH